LVDTDPAIEPGHDQVGVRWTIRDVGNGDRPVTSGSALFRRVDK
jgi:hypothetical protein